MGGLETARGNPKKRRMNQPNHHHLATALAAFGVALAVPFAGAQEPAAPGARIEILEMTPAGIVSAATERIEAGNYAGAVELLEDWPADAGERPPEADYLLGLAHFSLGNFADALAPAERAATQAAGAPVSWLELVAAVLKQRNEHRAAIPWLERLIEAAPENKTYWLELSLAYEQIDDLDRALATMRLAHTQSLLNDDADLRRLSDLLINRGLPQQSAVVLEQGLASQTVRADEATYTKLGTAWFTAGEPDKAVFPLENAARIANSGDAYVRLAVVHIDREDWAAAVNSLHAGMARGSLSDEAHANLLMGVALYAQGKLGEARDWFTMAAESDRHRAAANDYLAAIQAREPPEL
jgi:tetratricopeptide (TPR) repeat protein